MIVILQMIRGLLNRKRHTLFLFLALLFFVWLLLRFKQEKRIIVLMVLSENTSISNYKYAIDSVHCYSKIHGYEFILAWDKEYRHQCPQTDKFFRRHCISATLLAQADYLLYLDADMGVVNPKRKIEYFFDSKADLIFYDRFYDQEVAAGSYLAKNEPWVLAFLHGFANFEKAQYRRSFHGSDNGAIHAFLAKTQYPQRRRHFKLCWSIYRKSQSTQDLFTYVNCMRNIMGMSEYHGRVKVLPKGTAWCRDNWLTNSLWNPEQDTFIHGWKTNQLKAYNVSDLPLSAISKTDHEWLNPLAGPISLDHCVVGNTTWNYDKHLLVKSEIIAARLEKLYWKYELDRYHYLSEVLKMLNSSYFQLD